MVNEINKPNDQLSERLAASNRQLREMQEEHRQLLEEMEVLRARATELSRINVERQQLQQRVTQSSQSEEIVSESRSTSTTSSSMQSMRSESVSQTVAAQQEIKSEATSSNVASIESAEDHTAKMAQSLAQLTFDAEAEAEADNDPESAEYIQQKIAEIAALKAQYKRVEHMVNTTNLIEQHLKTKSTATEVQAQQIEAKTSAHCSQIAEASSSSSVSSSQSTGTAEAAVTSGGDKEELLNAMLNMFTDFSDDLRGQAESLREERARIRSLKEELMVRRKGDS